MVRARNARRAFSIRSDRTAKSLRGFIEAAVEPGAIIVTDAWSGYGDLDKLGYACPMPSKPTPVIKLYDPEFSVRGISIRRRVQGNPWFRRGTLFRHVLDTLRTVTAPMTVGFTSARCRSATETLIT